MQELLTAISYPFAWLFCSYVLKIENGLIKLAISLIVAILVYLYVGIKISEKEKKEDQEK